MIYIAFKYSRMLLSANLWRALINVNWKYQAIGNSITRIEVVKWKLACVKNSFVMFVVFQSGIKLSGGTKQIFEHKLINFSALKILRGNNYQRKF